MNKLGLIGGVGPESTIPYYRGIVYGVQEKVKKQFFPPLTIESLSAFEVIGMSSQGKYEELIEYFMKGINNLAASGADFAALACNTGHIVFDELQSKSPIPLLSIVDVTRDEAKRRGLTKVGLIGTIATMNGRFFKEPFIKVGIEVVTPSNYEKEFIAEKITNELELGIVNKETVEAFLKIIKRMSEEENIEALVLGCTELALLFKDAKLPVPALDTMEIHIKALVEKIVEDDK